MVDAHLGDDLYLDCPPPPSHTASKLHHNTIFLVTKNGFDNCLLDEDTNLKALITCHPNSTNSKTYKTHITNFLPFGDFITYFVGREYYFLSKFFFGTLPPKIFLLVKRAPFTRIKALPISFQQISYPIGGICNSSNSRVLLRVKSKQEPKSKPLYSLMDRQHPPATVTHAPTTKRTTTSTTTRHEILLLESDYYSDYEHGPYVASPIPALVSSSNRSHRNQYTLVAFFLFFLLFSQKRSQTQ
jgi:hypothetical protein